MYALHCGYCVFAGFHDYILSLEKENTCVEKVWKKSEFCIQNVYKPCNSFHYTIGTTVAVEMVDIGIQSETEDLSDIDSGAQQLGRKPSVLQVVPEEEHEEDNELVNL